MALTSRAGAFLKIRAILALPDKISQTKRRHPGHRLFRESTRLRHLNAVERDLDEVMLRLHGDRVFHGVRPRLHAQRLVYVGIANFRARFWTKLRPDAASAVVIAVVVAASLPDVLENFRDQLCNGLADAEEVRRVLRGIPGVSEILVHTWQVAIEAESFRFDDVRAGWRDV